MNYNSVKLLKMLNAAFIFLFSLVKQIILYCFVYGYNVIKRKP
jgi:hypothetical protein